jgi:hypothetical protein
MALLLVGCSSSPTSTDGVAVAPVFTARLVTPDTVELTIDNRASARLFLMETCSMSRERFEGGVWTNSTPLGELLQCGGFPSGFPAGEVTTFRKSYVAIGSDGAPERVVADAIFSAPGVMVLWPDGAVTFASEPFPGGIKE